MAKGYVNFVLDLCNVPFPTTRCIALLIALTVRARRRQGDVRLINVTHTARSNFVTFSALSYLTIEDEGKDATAAQVTVVEGTASIASAPKNTSKRHPAPTMPSIDAAVSQPTARAPNPVTSMPGREGKIFEEEAAALTDIVDPPLVEEFSRKIEEQKEQSDATEKKFQIRVESRTSNLYQLCDFVTMHAAAAGMCEKDIGKMKIAVYEACLNVIEHAYHSRPDEWIDLRVRYSPDRFMIIIQDYGLSFEMQPPKAYDVQEVMDERRSGGFGLHIIRRSMDSIEYHPDALNGNRFVMVKRLR
ncbi:MAG: ATP-binding protein [candidate division KSB1 bacterium]|nr:ATP-binding protein [candidate division KSB1 bacterium]